MLEPGREMDAAVSKAFSDRWEIAIGYDENGSPILDIPPFSSREDWAWRVVRAMVDDGFQVVIAAGTGEGMDAYVDFERGFEHSDAQDDTLAETVCVAALRALGVEV